MVIIPLVKEHAFAVIIYLLTVPGVTLVNVTPVMMDFIQTTLISAFSVQSRCFIVAIVKMLIGVLGATKVIIQMNTTFV